MHTTGFNIRRGIRHIEEDNDFPAWLALETATMFFHGFVAGWAQRCHCAIGTPETANGSNGLGQPNALRFAFDLRVLDLRRTHYVFGGQFSQFRLRVMVGHVAGVPLALSGLIPQIGGAFGHRGIVSRPFRLGPVKTAQPNDFILAAVALARKAID
jgi:hypothetical protein